MRIIKKTDLESRIETINNSTVFEKNGKLELSEQNGGFDAVIRYPNSSVRDFYPFGHGTKRELYNMLCATKNLIFEIQNNSIYINK